jgi:hypothetical protein
MNDLGKIPPAFRHSAQFTNSAWTASSPIRTFEPRPNCASDRHEFCGKKALSLVPSLDRTLGRIDCSLGQKIRHVCIWPADDLPDFKPRSLKRGVINFGEGPVLYSLISEMTACTSPWGRAIMMRFATIGLFFCRFGKNQATDSMSCSPQPSGSFL